MQIIMLAVLAAVAAWLWSSQRVAVASPGGNTALPSLQTYLLNPAYRLKSRHFLHIERAASLYGVPAPLLDAIIHIESSDGLDPRTFPGVIGAAGERGAMQIIPATEKKIKEKYPELLFANPDNISAAIALGAALCQMNYQTYGDWQKAAIAYNSPRVNEANHPYLVKLYKFFGV